MAPAYNTAEEFPHPPGTITVREAAKRTGLAYATLLGYCKSRHLGHIVLHWRYGRAARRATYIPLQDLYRFMAARAYTKLYRKSGKKVKYVPATQEFKGGKFAKFK